MQLQIAMDIFYDLMINAYTVFTMLMTKYPINLSTDEQLLNASIYF